MPDTYEYKVRDKSGNTDHGHPRGRQRAAGPPAPARAWATRPLEVGKEKKGLNLEINVTKAKVKLKDLAVFSRQFATMINSGLPILRALSILADQTENKLLARGPERDARWTSSRARRCPGAMAKHPKVFNDLYVSMVKSGETGGSLDDHAAVAGRDARARGAPARQDQVGDDLSRSPSSCWCSLIMSAMLLLRGAAVQEHLQPAGRHAAAARHAPCCFMSQTCRRNTGGCIVIGADRVRGSSSVGGRRPTRAATRSTGSSSVSRCSASLFHKTALSRFSSTLAMLLQSGVPDPAGPGHRGRTR